MDPRLRWVPGVSRRFLPVTSSSDRGRELPTPETSGSCYLPLGTGIKRLVSGMAPATAVCFRVIILLTLRRVRLILSIDLSQLQIERNQDFATNRTDTSSSGKPVPMRAERSVVKSIPDVSHEPPGPRFPPSSPRHTFPG